MFEGTFSFRDTHAYPPAPELATEDPQQKHSLPLAQRIHTLSARALTRTHWLYTPESFVPAVQLVEAYDQHTQRMTGTGPAAFSSTVTTGTATAEPQRYYIDTDHLGTPQELTDSEGRLQWAGHYRAWGELAKANDSDGNAARVEMPLRFQGQYCDAETGLHYNRHRYYDPQLGRFTTQDPISLAGGVNLYQYAPNPVGWVDPFGLSKVESRTCNRKQALNQAKDLAGIPRSQQPDRQWTVGNDPKRRGQTNYKYSEDMGSHGRYYEYSNSDGHKRVVVEHTADPRASSAHTHAGGPKGDLNDHINNRNYDFKNDRYQKIDNPKTKDHHIYYE